MSKEKIKTHWDVELQNIPPINVKGSISSILEDGLDLFSDLYRLPERKDEGRFKVTKDKFYH